jgi:CRISPR-associated Cas5-like protein
MADYTISFEISGATAMWTRPDTGDAPVSYPAPTYSAAKEIFKFVVWITFPNDVSTQPKSLASD